MLPMSLNPVLRIAASRLMHGRLLFGHEALPVKVQSLFLAASSSHSIRFGFG